MKLQRSPRAGQPVRTFTKLGGIAAVLVAAATPLSAVPAQAQGRSLQVSSAGDVTDFYRARGNQPLWFSPRAGTAAQQVMALLESAQVDGLDRRRYVTKALNKAMRQAYGRDPRATQRAELLLSQAFVAYARDMRRDPNVGMIYVDRELMPQPASARALLDAAAAAPSLDAFVSNIGWMNPIYGQLRHAISGHSYTTDTQRRLLMVNLERARVLPTGRQRYVVVNAAAQRLYMFENGQVVDYMRVVVGKPKYATPMMAAQIRFASLNPYWNVPPDLAAERIAPNAVKGGLAYLKAKGYQVLSDWSENARVIPASSVNWKAVAGGQQEVRLRQLPGPGNSMGRMKFMFPNDQGIYLHDTPEKELLTESARLFSGGCVRLEDAPRLGRWLFGKPLKPAGAKPEQKVMLPAPVPVYLTYLTAVPSGSSVAWFEDIYGRDAQRLGQQQRRMASR